MEFRYIGKNYGVQVFGLYWSPGTVQNVEDAHAIGKLSNHVEFEAVGGGSRPANLSVPKPELPPQLKEALHVEPQVPLMPGPRRRGPSKHPKYDDGNE